MSLGGRKINMRAVYWVLIGALAVGCSVNPVSGRPELVLTSAEQERAIGREEALKLEKQFGFLEEERYVRYVQAIGRRLAKQSPRRDVEYQFYVIELPGSNAFALPGGYVFVSRGLLAPPVAIATDPGAWATGIMSQRPGQVVEGIAALDGGLLLAPYSHAQEREADRVGQELAAAGGWDPRGMASFLHTLEREEALSQGGAKGMSFLDSHPSTPERVQMTAERARELERSVIAPIASSHVDFLGRLEGLRVGPNPAEGQFIGSQFLHPGLSFSLSFPEGWKTHNARDRVTAIAPGADAVAVLEIAGEGDDPWEAARKLGEEADIRYSKEPEEQSVDGRRAVRAIGYFRGKAVDLSWLPHDGYIYQITGICPESAFDTYGERFASVAGSFEPLTTAQRAQIREVRLRLIPAQGDESIEQLLERAGSVWGRAEAAVANALDAESPLHAGKLVKLPISEPHQ
jgi:predicted Zn-dependent protease